MNRFVSTLAAQSSIGYLLLRLMTGIILALAGYNKIFVTGLAGVTGFFEKDLIPLPQLTAPLVSFLELLGGILIIAGLFTRYVSVLFVIEFIVAAYTKWVTMAQGFAGARIDLMILFAAILFATKGPGNISVDAKMGRG